MNIYTRENAVGEILKLKKESPYFINLIRNNDHKDLLKWINDEINNLYSNFNDSLGSKIFLILNPNFELICSYGNKQKYRPSTHKFSCKRGCKCIQYRTKETCLEKYGTDNPGKSEKIKEENKQKFIKNWGVNNPSKSSIIKTRIKETFIKNYVSGHPMREEKVQKIIKNTCMKNSGYDNPSKNPKVKQQKIDTCIENNGVSFYAQKHFSQETIKILENKDVFTKMLIKYGVIKLSKILGCTPVTIYNYHKRYNLNIITDTGTSSYELELSNFLNENNIQFVSNTWKPLKKFELDFYCPNINFAIEFQGTYWHMDPRKYNEHDINKCKGSAQKIWERDARKSKLCKEKEIDLMIIWELDWNSKKEEIKNDILQYISNKSINTIEVI